MDFLHQRKLASNKLNQDKIIYNIENIPNSKTRMMNIKKNWFNTVKRLKTTTERKTKLDEYKQEVFKLKLHRNMIIKHNVT